MFASPEKWIVSPKARNWILYHSYYNILLILCVATCPHMPPLATTCHVTLVDMCLIVCERFCAIIMNLYTCTFFATSSQWLLEASIKKTWILMTPTQNTRAETRLCTGDGRVWPRPSEVWPVAAPEAELQDCLCLICSRACFKLDC